MGKKILVVGAGGALGLQIARVLGAQGHAVTATYRTARPGLERRIAEAGAVPARLELRDTGALAAALNGMDAAVFTPILTESRGAAAALAPGQRAVFFSSNNVAVAPDLPVYAALAAAEAPLQRAAPQAVILRPTMIYGHPADGNLSLLMRQMMTSRVVLRPARGGLQQPVFYRDLAGIAAEMLLQPPQDGQIVSVGGPDIVSYAGLYRAIARAAGTRPLRVPVPAGLAARLVPTLRRVGLDFPVSDEQLRRVARDKRATGPRVVLGGTPLAAGLADLAAALRAAGG